jgi:hypothetical protein
MEVPASIIGSAGSTRRVAGSFPVQKRATRAGKKIPVVRSTATVAQAKTPSAAAVSASECERSEVGVAAPRVPWRTNATRTAPPPPRRRARRPAARG